MEQRFRSLIYLPVEAIFYGIALLPWKALYWVSDAIFFIIYHLIGYRKKVVKHNLTTSFPDKSAAELKAIERQFYRNFADYFVETIKLLHISDEEMRKRMIFSDVEIIDKFLSQNRSVVIYFSHTFNWEWAPSITLWSKFDTDTNIFGEVYRPLNNAWFDSIFLKLRSRFKTHNFPKNTVLRGMLANKMKKVNQVVGFMSDQHPNVNDQDHVVMFLNHPTAIITGTELLARKLDTALVFFDLEHPKRGHYHCTVRLIAERAKDGEMGCHTDAYARILEENIKRDPALWLWTHKRWKRPVQMPGK